MSLYYYLPIVHCVGYTVLGKGIDNYCGTAHKCAKVITGDSVYNNLSISADTISNIPLSVDIEKLNMPLTFFNGILNLLIQCSIMTSCCIYFHNYKIFSHRLLQTKIFFLLLKSVYVCGKKLVLLFKFYN